MKIEQWDWTYDGMELSEDGMYICSDDHRLIVEKLEDRIDNLMDDLRQAINS